MWWKQILVLSASVCLLGCSESGGGTSGTQGPSELFAFPKRFLIGSGFPAGIVRGDLDGDQVADLVVPLFADFGSQETSAVVLTYLDRSGLPVRSVELMDARQPSDAAISDCNGDGRVDVVVLDTHGEVLVYLQKSDGSFEVPLPFAVGEGPFRLIVARWDGDLVNDLLTVNGHGQSVCVLPGRGDGTFEQARFTSLGVFGVHDAAAGDLDQDGALDLAFINFNAGFVLFGSGDGRFGTPEPFPVGSSVTAVRVADVTGDALPDIVQTNYNTRDLRVLEGDGAGGFTEGFTFFVGAACIGTVETGDLDGDGIVDIALGTNEGITPILGLGSGDFSPGLPFSPGGSPIEFTLGDRDDDLDLDLLSVVADSDGFSQANTFVTVLDGEGDGTFEGPCAYDAGPSCRALTIGDFVIDGVPDLAVTNNDPPAISVLAGLGNGSFDARIRTPLSSSGDALIAFDLDGNTLEDLLVVSIGNAAGELTLLSSTGTGTFDASFPFSGGGIEPVAVEVGDLDSDQFPDLVVCNRLSNQIAVHLGSPGGFSRPVRFGVGAFPTDVELEDLDGDGILDAAVPNHPENTTSVLIGLGDGFFSPDVSFATFEGPQELEIGDFDQDGIDDLLVVCTGAASDSGRVVLLPGVGDGTFSFPQLVAEIEDALLRLAVADLDRDGRLDIVTNSFSRLYMQLAQGPASSPQIFSASQFLSSTGIADFDADGKADIALTTGSQALVFLNQGR